MKKHPRICRESVLVLRAWRRELGMTQESVALTMHTARSRIVELERGRRDCVEEFWRRWFAALEDLEEWTGKR